MAFLDSQGRLFGKFSLLDIGAALVILLVVVGLLFVPGKSGTSIAQSAAGKPIEVDVLVLGLGAKAPQGMIQQGQKTNFIIRNQAYGQVDIQSVQFLPKTVTVSQPDGSVKALPDPRPELAYSNNLLLTLVGKGDVTPTGPVLGNNSVKVGTPVELEGKEYNFKGSVIEVRSGP
jgi:Domain of unknown function (DUF4330)